MAPTSKHPQTQTRTEVPGLHQTEIVISLELPIGQQQVDGSERTVVHPVVEVIQRQRQGGPRQTQGLPGRALELIQSPNLTRAIIREHRASSFKIQTPTEIRAMTLQVRMLTAQDGSTFSEAEAQTAPPEKTQLKKMHSPIIDLHSHGTHRRNDQLQALLPTSVVIGSPGRHRANLKVLQRTARTDDLSKTEEVVKLQHRKVRSRNLDSLVQKLIKTQVTKPADALRRVGEWEINLQCRKVVEQGPHSKDRPAKMRLHKTLASVEGRRKHLPTRKLIPSNRRLMTGSQ